MFEKRVKKEYIYNANKKPFGIHYVHEKKYEIFFTEFCAILNLQGCKC
jgi:hypothetical protein